MVKIYECEDIEVKVSGREFLVSGKIEGDDDNEERVMEQIVTITHVAEYVSHLREHEPIAFDPSELTSTERGALLEAIQDHAQADAEKRAEDRASR